MHKWRLEDNSVSCFCDTCSKEKYKELVIRESWKESDLEQSFTCEKCGAIRYIELDGTAREMVLPRTPSAEAGHHIHARVSS